MGVEEEAKLEEVADADVEVVLVDEALQRVNSDDTDKDDEEILVLQAPPLRRWQPLVLPGAFHMPAGMVEPETTSEDSFATAEGSDPYHIPSATLVAQDEESTMEAEVSPSNIPHAQMVNRMIAFHEEDTTTFSKPSAVTIPRRCRIICGTLLVILVIVGLSVAVAVTSSIGLSQRQQTQQDTTSNDDASLRGWRPPPNNGMYGNHGMYGDHDGDHGGHGGGYPPPYNSSYYGNETFHGGYNGTDQFHNGTDQFHGVGSLNSSSMSQSNGHDGGYGN